MATFILRCIFKKGKIHRRIFSYIDSGYIDSYAFSMV